MLIDLLLSHCNYDFAVVSDLIDPLLTAESRCQLTSLYIHGIVTPHGPLLATNLDTAGQPNQVRLLSGAATTWLLGRSQTCAIALCDRTVSRCHATLGFCPRDGFYLIDVGSRGGTYVNRHLLLTHHRRPLRDGDLLEFGRLRVEFFQHRHDQPYPHPQEEPTYM
jgi:hypothetical protein